uniref:BTB domain-containing protein n=1 Tax=Oryza meridionalis TaxID=40149 RepID=A0A0E0EY50_9ORYZ
MSSAACRCNPSRSASASAVVVDTATGYHLLKIEGYSLTKGIPASLSLKSSQFTVGGYRWRIDYFPNGDCADSADYISLFLSLDERANKDVKVRASWRFQIGYTGHVDKPPSLSTAKVCTTFGVGPDGSWSWGYDRFIRREDFEKSDNLRDDSFTIRCDIAVVRQFRVEETTEILPLETFVSVPPSDMNQQFGDLLETEKGADVVFEVGGETFAAHWCVLAARSPVFRAELYSLMKEGDTAGVVRIEDMEAQVFKLLLRFVYTDSLPEMENDDEDVMCQHLLVAADRYNLERLKLICEEKLCSYISVDAVSNILALADQHHCDGLKKACFHFLASPVNLNAVIASDGLKHLSRSFPSLMEELVAMLVSRCNFFSVLPPSSADGHGNASTRSTSAIVVDRVTGHHLFKIDGYSFTKETPIGTAIASGEFTVGGYRWRIEYYPNGRGKKSADYISLYLSLDKNTSGKVKVKYQFDLADRVKKQPSLISKPVRTFGRADSWTWGFPKFMKRRKFEKSKYLKDDCFTIRCDMVVMREIRALRKQHLCPFPHDLKQQLGDLLETGKGADVVFEVGGETFAAHRYVLAARSPVFSAEFFGSMKESDAAAGGVVRIEEMEAQVFKVLLRFVYTDSLPKMEEDIMCQHLLVAADRYNLKRFKLICEKKLCKYISVGTVANILALADQHYCEGLKKACFNFLGSSANGYHLLKINGYSLTKGTPNGKPLISSQFTVGGHCWRIYYYPNGNLAESANHMSLFLWLDEKSTKDVNVQARLKFRINGGGQMDNPPSLAMSEVKTFCEGFMSWGHSTFIKREDFEKSKNLRDDSFTIRCDIVVVCKIRVEETTEIAFPGEALIMSVPPSNMNHQLGDLLETGKGADVVFEVAGQTFAAHRCVLAARSPVFSAELYGPMKESDTTTGVVRVEDMEAQVFRALLRFVYTDSLPKMEEEGVMCQHLLVAADRYNLERLKLICEEKLCKHVSVHTVSNLLVLADQHRCEWLKKACVNFSLSRSWLSLLKELVNPRNSSGDGEQFPVISASASASAVVVDTATGYHLLKIESYSLTKDTTPVHSFINSSQFTVGGYRWRIEYYPNGYWADSADYISLFLSLDERANKDVKVQAKLYFQISYTDQVVDEPPPSLASAKLDTFGEGSWSWGYAEFIKREDFEKSKDPKDDSFTIRCDIVVVLGTRTEGRTKILVPAETFVSVPPSNMNQQLGNLLECEKGADVVFEVGGQTFAAHRCVLAARSPVFSAELYGLMKEGDTTGVVWIEEMEARVFKLLLHFVYTDSLPEMKTEEDVMSQDLLVAADRYNLERLKLICEERLCSCISVGTVSNILALADQHHCDGLKKACFNFLGSPANLSAVIAGNGLKHLSRSCPSLMEELVAMLAPPPSHAYGDGEQFPVISASASASAVVVDTATGYHLLKIESYSLTKDTTPVHSFINSSQFTVGGYRWRIEYYPNGYWADSADYISLFLSLDERANKDVKVQAKLYFQISYTDQVVDEPPPSLASAKLDTFGEGSWSWGYAEFIKREDFEKSKDPKDDSFTIRCDIVVVLGTRTEGRTKILVPAETFVSVPPSNMNQQLGNLLECEKGADVVFEVGGQTFAAHRCVLAARSPVFSAELYGLMKEGDTTGVVWIEEMEARVFKLLLHFVYTDSLPEMKTEEDVMSQDLLVAADRYNLERLKLICEERLCSCISVGTVSNILALADQHHCDGLKKACFNFLGSPANLSAVIAGNGLKHLSRSCPSLMEELVAMLAPPPSHAYRRRRTSSPRSRSTSFYTVAAVVALRSVREFRGVAIWSVVTDNCCVVRCDVVVGAAASVSVPPSDLQRYLGHLLETKLGADVTFEVGGETFPAHRCVLAARSPVFKAELFGGMKESDAADGGAIRVEAGMDACYGLQALLHFVYTNSLPEPEMETEEEELVMFQNLLAAARTCTTCQEKLCQHIDVSTVEAILALAEAPSCTNTEACLEFIRSPANLKAVFGADRLRHLTTTCPSVLPEIIADLLASTKGHVGLLLHRRLSPSSSAITAGATSGYYLLVVEGYSRTKDTVPNGECVSSRPFRVGGCHWVIDYYPNGESSDDADYISVFLQLDDQDDDSRPVMAHYEFSFIDQVEKQEATHICSETFEFPYDSQYWARGYHNFIERKELEKSKHLKDDCFTIRCDIIVKKDGSNTTVSAGGDVAAPLVAVPPSDMHRQFTDLLLAKGGADVTFEVGGETFAAHRCVLAARSTVFMAELFGPMEEGTTASVIHISDMLPEAFKAMLAFIYNDTPPPETEEDEDGKVAMWQHLLVAADRYDLPRLKLICEEKLCGHIGVGTATTILLLADKHHCRGLKEACLEFLSSPANLEEVMEHGGLEDVVGTCPSVLVELIAKLALLRTQV